MNRATNRPRNAAVLAWLRLARIYHKVDSASAQLFRRYDQLSTAQFDVLAHVGAAEGISQQELAASLLVTKGNISQLLVRLERDGLVQRRQDGRRNCLALTPAGRTLYEQVVPAQENSLATMFAPLNDEEQSQLLRLLRKLDQSIQ